MSFKRWQKLMARRILKTVFSRALAEACAGMAVNFVLLAIYWRTPAALEVTFVTDGAGDILFTLHEVRFD